MMSVLSELRTNESFGSRPSLALLAAVFAVLFRAGTPARVWSNRYVGIYRSNPEEASAVGPFRESKCTDYALVNGGQSLCRS